MVGSTEAACTAGPVPARMPHRRGHHQGQAHGRPRERREYAQRRTAGVGAADADAQPEDAADHADDDGVDQN